MKADVFITGATGYLGGALVPELQQRGHSVRALVRSGSEHRLPGGCEAVVGNVLDRATFTRYVRSGDTFVHLVGTPRPSPAKARQFREVDLVSAREAVEAAKTAGVGHFVYVSVAHPAPVMAAYIAVRVEAEALIRSSGIPATILRPWYVLGPGHLWPHALRPFYWALERFPATRDGARRLGLVTLAQMTRVLVGAIEHPPERFRILTVTEIRRGSELDSGATVSGHAAHL